MRFRGLCGIVKILGFVRWGAAAANIFMKYWACASIVWLGSFHLLVHRIFRTPEAQCCYPHLDRRGIRGGGPPWLSLPAPWLRQELPAAALAWLVWVTLHSRLQGALSWGLTTTCFDELRCCRKGCACLWLPFISVGPDRAFGFREGVSAQSPEFSGWQQAQQRDPPFPGAASRGGVGPSLSEDGKGGTSRNWLGLLTE